MWVLILGRVTWNGDDSIVERTMHATFDDVIEKIRREHPKWLEGVTATALCEIEHDARCYGHNSIICGNAEMGYSISYKRGR